MHFWANVKDDSFTYLMFIISDSSSFHTKRKEISKQTAQHEGYQEMCSTNTDSSRYEHYGQEFLWNWKLYLEITITIYNTHFLFHKNMLYKNG